MIASNQDGVFTFAPSYAEGLRAYGDSEPSISFECAQTAEAGSFTMPAGYGDVNPAILFPMLNQKPVTLFESGQAPFRYC